MAALGGGGGATGVCLHERAVLEHFAFSRQISVSLRRKFSNLVKPSCPDLHYNSLSRFSAKKYPLEITLSPPAQCVPYVSAYPAPMIEGVADSPIGGLWVQLLVIAMFLLKDPGKNISTRYNRLGKKERYVSDYTTGISNVDVRAELLISPRDD